VGCRAGSAKDDYEELKRLRAENADCGAPGGAYEVEGVLTGLLLVVGFAISVMLDAR
jgi:hypothetical protein